MPNSKQQRDRRKHLFQVDKATMFHPKLLVAMENEELFGDMLKKPIPEVYTFPLFSEKFCRDIVWFSEMVLDFKEDEVTYDLGVECRSLHTTLYRAFEIAVAGIIQNMYQLVLEGVLPATLVRLAEGQEQEPHYDPISDVTVRVPLTPTPGGGALEFVAPAWSTAKVPVGHVIIYPGKVTHRRKMTKATAGTTYSLMWQAQILSS